VLTLEQKQFFDQNGYLVLPGFKDGPSCQQLIERAFALIEGFDSNSHRTVFSTLKEADEQRADYFMSSGDKIRFFFEAEAFDQDGNLVASKAESINKIGHGLQDLDPHYSSFSRDPRLAELVKDLGISDARLIQGMHICKQPRIGGEVRPHQDSSYLYTEPESTIGLWFALEDASLENGCLWALPGGHKGPLESRYERGENNSASLRNLSQPNWPEEAWVPLQVAQGSLIVMHGCLPHKSEANRSARSRHAYTLHIIDGQHTYQPGNWLQRPTDNPATGF